MPFKLAFTIALGLALAFTISQAAENSFTDLRDNRTYRTAKIGTQTWFAENLNYNLEGSKCYDNKPENCAKYGRSYGWEMAMKACPKGWHLPSNKEWDVLVDFAGGEDFAGKYLKAKSGWEEDWVSKGKAGNGEDKFGFAALPSGSGYICNWWSATEFDARHAYFRSVFYYDEQVYELYNFKSDFYSVRCLQD